MASLFKQTYTKHGVKRTVRKWYGKYRDADGHTRKTPLARDKSVAQSMIAELVRKVERQKAGFNTYDEHLQR